MITPIPIPRVNSNVDVATLVKLDVRKGDRLTAGQVIGAIETEKAVLVLQAPSDGFVIDICYELGAVAETGSILMWLGDSLDETAPARAIPDAADPPVLTTPTAKALALLRAFRLKAEEVPFSGARLRAEDVERHVRQLGRPMFRRSVIDGLEADTPERSGSGK